MSFFAEQICKLKDISTCLKLYEDISYMDLAFQNKIIHKLQCVIEDVKIYNLDMAIASERDLTETTEGLYILDISLDITDICHLLIDALEENNSFMIKECCIVTEELFKEVI